MLELIDNWRIDNETSSDNIILQQLITRARSKDADDGSYKKGDEYQAWKNEGYYSTIDACIISFIKSKAIMGLEDWDEVVAILKRIELKIKDIFEPKYIRGKR